MGRAHHTFPTGHHLANVLPHRKSSSPEKHSLTKTDMDILEPSPAKGHEGDEGLGASVMKGETESWQRSAGEEKVQGDLIHMYPYLKGSYEESDYSVVPHDRTRGNGHKVKQAIPSRQKKIIFYSEGGRCPERL